MTLDLNGESSPYWNLDAGSICIFVHPSLQELKVSCVNIGDDMIEGVSKRHFTPLRDLMLTECNTTPRGLIGLLSLPKALEMFHLGVCWLRLLRFYIPLLTTYF